MIATPYKRKSGVNQNDSPQSAKKFKQSGTPNKQGFTPQQNRPGKAFTPGKTFTPGKPQPATITPGKQQLSGQKKTTGPKPKLEMFSGTTKLNGIEKIKSAVPNQQSANLKSLDGLNRNQRRHKKGQLRRQEWRRNIAETKKKVQEGDVASRKQIEELVKALEARPLQSKSSIKKLKYLQVIIGAPLYKGKPTYQPGKQGPKSVQTKQPGQKIKQEPVTPKSQKANPIGNVKTEPQAKPGQKIKQEPVAPKPQMIQQRKANAIGNVKSEPQAKKTGNLQQQQKSLVALKQEIKSDEEDSSDEEEEVSGEEEETSGEEEEASGEEEEASDEDDESDENDSGSELNIPKAQGKPKKFEAVAKASPPGKQNPFNQGKQNQFNQGKQNQFNKGKQNQFNKGKQNQFNKGSPNQFNKGSPNQFNKGSPNQFNKGKPENEEQTSLQSKPTGKIQQKLSTQSKPDQNKKTRYVVFVGNLPYSATKEEIQQHFNKAGGILDVRIPPSGDSKKPRGFAYVEVKDEQSYQKALSLNHTFIGGRRLNVLYTKGGKKKSPNQKQEIKAKNLKMRALGNQGRLAGSVKADQKRSVRRAKNKQRGN